MSSINGSLAAIAAGLLTCGLSSFPIHPPAHFHKLAHTYSIVARDPQNGDLGVAVQSKFPNVGGIVPWAKAGVGAVATQSLSNTAYGERGLELMAEGATAEEALRILTRNDPSLQDRQAGMVDARGNSASFSGTTTFDWSGGRVGRPDGAPGSILGGKGQLIAGRNYAAQANIMVSDQTVKNLAETFERSTGSLADRLVAALKPGRPAAATSAACSRPRCSSSARMAGTSAATIGSSTSASTMRPTRSPSSSGCSRCTSCTSSRAIPRTCFR